ncbi:MAG: hypothetical protein ACQERC_11830 [Bacteroidota bacterium]
MRLLILLFTLGCMTFYACRKDKVESLTPVEDECDTTISFVNEVQPILSINCSTSGCHDENTASAGYRFVTYDQIEAETAMILKVMRHESGVSPMPQGGQKLSDSTIQKIECWKQQGKLFN